MITKIYLQQLAKKYKLKLFKAPETKSFQISYGEIFPEIIEKER